MFAEFNDLCSFTRNQFPAIAADLDQLTELISSELKYSDPRYVEEVVRVYFILYAAPIFDRVGLWNHSEPTTKRRLRKLLDAHLWFNVHTRLSDIVVDRDECAIQCTEKLRMAYRCLLHAREAVEAAGEDWTHQTMDLFERYLCYDAQITSLGAIEPNNLCERISPMLVVPEIYLIHDLSDLDRLYIRTFFNFMLLTHDISDVPGDLQSGRLTLATSMIGKNHDFSRATTEMMFSRCESHLERFARLLFDSLNRDRFPFWSLVVQFCVQSYKFGIKRQERA
jgi:hypothetical protein